jgi:hypothetical protein
MVGLIPIAGLGIKVYLLFLRGDHMNQVTRELKVTHELKAALEHLAERGVLTPSDATAICHALEHVQGRSSTQAPQTLSGPYYEARSKALYDRKVHP